MIPETNLSPLPERIVRILVIQLKHLGDVLLSTPVIDALANAFPSAKISILVNSGMEEMVSGHPRITEIIALPPDLRVEKGWQRLRSEAVLLRRLRASRFDLAVNLSRGDRGGWLSVLAGAPIRLGYRVASQEPGYRNWFYNRQVDQPTESIHEVEKNLRLLSGLGVRPHRIPLTFVVPEETKRWAEGQLQPAGNKKVIHVHPTSRWMFKCWEPAKVAAVISRLQSEGWHAVMTCGPGMDELKHCQAILHHAEPDLVHLGSLSLKGLGGLIAGADVFLGVDSAPMHMAAALRTPTVALFGPTGVENWSPWLEASRVLRKPCPCKEARAERCDWTRGVTRQCLRMIEVDEVIQAVHQVANDNR